MNKTLLKNVALILAVMVAAKYVPVVKDYV